MPAVIRLKQVEHVRNERNTLAAIAGHPFITTMITSFSDRDCLYMLVSVAGNWTVTDVLLIRDSSIIVPAARFLHIYEEQDGSTNRRLGSTLQRLY